MSAVLERDVGCLPASHSRTRRDRYSDRYSHLRISAGWELRIDNAMMDADESRATTPARDS